MQLRPNLRRLRSLLFLPATANHLLAKASERGADALVVDLEDAIPPTARHKPARWPVRPWNNWQRAVPRWCCA